MTQLVRGRFYAPIVQPSGAANPAFITIPQSIYLCTFAGAEADQESQLIPVGEPVYGNGRLSMLSAAAGNLMAEMVVQGGTTLGFTPGDVVRGLWLKGVNYTLLRIMVPADQTSFPLSPFTAVGIMQEAGKRWNVLNITLHQLVMVARIQDQLS